MTSRNSLKLSLISSANVSHILGLEFVSMLEEIEKSIEAEAEDKHSPTPSSTDQATYGSTNNYPATILSPPVPDSSKHENRPATEKDTTVTDAFKQVIASLEKLPILSELKRDDESELSQSISSLQMQVKSLAEAAKLSDNKSRGYKLIELLTMLAKGIVYLASILSGAFLGNAASSAVPAMAIPGAVTGGIVGYKAADKALLACSNYAGINMFNRRPHQAKTTKKLAEILESKIPTFRT